MKIKTSLCLALAVAASLAPVEAALLTYTSKSAFVGDLLPGYDLNDFTSLPVNFDTPYLNVGFTNGASMVGYEVAAPPAGLYRTPAPDAAIGNWSSDDAVIVTFTTGNVRTIGADFFLLNFSGNRLPGTITVAFSDGTTADVPSYASGAYGFFGISSDTPIASLTVAPDPGGAYINLGSLYVSATQSVPATTVSVVAAISEASQAGPTSGGFTIARTNVNLQYDEPLPVNFVLGGTATNGTYTCLPDEITSVGTNTIVFAAGQTTTNVTITPVADGLSRPTTTVGLSLLQGHNYAPSAPASAVVNIQNTGPQLLFLSASMPSMYKRHTNDFGLLTITRWGNTNAPAYAIAGFTYGGSALLGADFTVASPVMINPGDVTVASRITPLDSSPGVYTGNKTIEVGLAASGDYTTSGGNPTLTIIDSANPPAELLYTNALTSAVDDVNWGITAANDDSGVPVDVEATFGYDLTSNLSGGGVIPPPPGGATSALRLTVNKLTAAATGLNVYPTNITLSGNFAVRFNLNLIVDTAAGTTQGPLFGVNHDGRQTNWWSGPVVSGGPWASDGIWYWVSADGVSLDGDYREFSGLGGALPNTGWQELTPGRWRTDFINVFKHPIPYSASGGPGLVANDPPALGGAPRTWSDVEIKQFGEVVSFSINKIPIFTYTNTTAFTNGHPMLGYLDPFASPGQAAGAAYFANLSVVRLTGPRITNLTRSGATVTIDFATVDGTVTTDSFMLQGAATVNGIFTDRPGAVVSQLPTGIFRVTTTSTDGAQFYRIRQK